MRVTKLWDDLRAKQGVLCEKIQSQLVNSMTNFVTQTADRPDFVALGLKYHPICLNIEAQLMSTYTAHPYPNTRLEHQGKGTVYPR